jgi:hypothetical protein
MEARSTAAKPLQASLQEIGAADLEVVPTSHEADESMTNPDGNEWYYKWYYNDLTHEIGDEARRSMLHSQQLPSYSGWTLRLAG